MPLPATSTSWLRSRPISATRVAGSASSERSLGSSVMAVKLSRSDRSLETLDSTAALATWSETSQASAAAVATTRSKLAPNTTTRRFDRPRDAGRRRITGYSVGAGPEGLPTYDPDCPGVDRTFDGDALGEGPSDGYVRRMTPATSIRMYSTASTASR